MSLEGGVPADPSFPTDDASVAFTGSGQGWPGPLWAQVSVSALHLPGFQQTQVFSFPYILVAIWVAGLSLCWVFRKVVMF